MNWTGGTLQRTKNANKGVIHKQRAYFARARTKLQQNPETPVEAFHPDFLHDGDDCGHGRRSPSFASGSILSAGHQARRRANKVRHTSPTVRKQRGVCGQRRSQQTSPRLGQYNFLSIDGREEQRGTKRKPAVTDTEAQLLEANKRRLLRQEDWIGVTPSKPVDLQYSSVKGRTRIGKRRKLDGKTRTATLRSPVTFRHRSSREELDGHQDAFMSGALPVLAAADNIQIRIGSDAMTTVASTQAINSAPSQTNSDSMLFDEEDNGAAHRQKSEVLPSSGHKLLTEPRSPFNRLAAFERSCSPQHGRPRYHSLTAVSEVHADERMRHAAADANALDPANVSSEATDPSYRLTHYVKGVERPFKLTFDGRSSGRIDHAASPTNSPVATQRTHANFHAKGVESGNAQRNVGKAYESAIRRQPCSSLIDDDEPWRPYLDTGITSSGQVRMDNWTGTSVLQPQVPAQSRRAEFTLRSQHGVRHNLTHANLLTVSASLPPPKQRSARLLGARPLPRADASKGFGHDEAFWKSCAIGSDPQSMIETIHTHDTASEGSTSLATKGYASTRLPLSPAVSPVSSTRSPSTPFASLSGQASRISDKAQHARRSGSRSIISAAPSYTVWGGGVSPEGEDVPGDKQGDETSAASLFGELSTQASLQNHASHFTAMSSYTKDVLQRSRPACALDRRCRAHDNDSRLAAASGSSVWRRDENSSTWDSDGAGIDLVDADRLT